MNVTESGFKNRQLHMEDYLQMVSAEQKEYAEVFDYSKITEKSGVITDYWTNNLLDLILRKDNLNEAYKQVKRNKGKGGSDGMQVDELLPFLRENQETLIQEIREGRYKPNPVRRVEIPKETKGEFRKLGVPTVVDRVVQQAIAQELTPIYEEQFSNNSFGFRPKRGAHDALRQCQKNVNDGYVYVVDMDLEKFFDTVCQSKLIEVLSRTIKDTVITCKNKKSANHALNLLQYIMAKLDLKLHPVKTKIVSMWDGKEGFDFLGMHHRRMTTETRKGQLYKETYQYPSRKTMKKMKAEVKRNVNRRSLLVAKEEDLIKNLNPKITGWKNYYSTKRNEKWMKALDWYIICTFTRWYNKKHQRRNRMSKVGFVRNSIYGKGLKKMARA